MSDFYLIFALLFALAWYLDVSNRIAKERERDHKTRRS